MLVSIIFDSGYGHTATQARAVSEGVRNVPGAEAELIAVSEGPVPWDKLEASDAIIFGAPTYNGSVSSRLKRFFEDSTKPVWNDMKWHDKVAAGFTNSGPRTATSCTR